VRATILSDPAHPFLYRPYQINDPSVGVTTQYVSPVADELAKVPGQDKSDAIFVRLNGYGSLVPISAALDWLADVVLNGARGRRCSDSPQQLQVVLVQLVVFCRTQTSCTCALSAGAVGETVGSAWICGSDYNGVEL
jgi:hypothetical protein